MFFFFTVYHTLFWNDTKTQHLAEFLQLPLPDGMIDNAILPLCTFLKPEIVEIFIFLSIVYQYHTSLANIWSFPSPFAFIVHKWLILTISHNDYKKGKTM